jgi:hypothetical protein
MYHTENVVSPTSHVDTSSIQEENRVMSVVQGEQLYNVNRLGIGLDSSNIQGENRVMSIVQDEQLYNVNRLGIRLESRSSSRINSISNEDESFAQYTNPLNTDSENISISYSSSSSVKEDVTSPNINTNSPINTIVYYPDDTDPETSIPRVQSINNIDPINITETTAFISRNRLNNLEYIEENLDKIVAFNLQKYIDNQKILNDTSSEYAI